jgi:pimeloyl-ACP methyl ester carboxylesterase
VGNLRTYGNPPFAVAAIHGGPGAAGEMSTVARELSSGVGVLEPLLKATSVDGEVEELRVALRDGDLPLVLIGFSWGAWLSLIFTARYPAFVNKLILVSSGPFEEKYAAGMMRTRLDRLDNAERAEAGALYEAMTNSVSPADRLARFGQLMAKADSYDPLPDESQSPAPDPEVYRSVWDEASKLRKDGRLLELARSITCPVVAIHGDYDPHPAEGVRGPLSKAIKDFKFVLLKNCGHYPWRERNARDTFYRILKAEIRQR